MVISNQTVWPARDFFQDVDMLAAAFTDCENADYNTSSVGCLSSLESRMLSREGVRDRPVNSSLK